MKQRVMRTAVYILGMLILAAGLTLNTKTGFGTSAIISVPFTVSEIWQLNFGNVTFVAYIFFVSAQLALRYTAAKRDRTPIPRRQMLLDVMQLPISLIFTRVMNFISAAVPVLSAAYPDSFLGSLVGRITVLLIAVAFVGIGAAMTLNMRFVPNPGDGIVQAISDFSGKPVGLVKNIFDLSCVAASLVLGFVFTGRLVGIGLGTVVAALGVGRVIALFNRLFAAQLCRLAGTDR